MSIRLHIDLLPPPGGADDDAEPARTELDHAGPGALPGVGQRFTFLDAWGRRQAGRVIARQDGAAEGDEPASGRVVAITVQAEPSRQA